MSPCSRPSACSILSVALAKTLRDIIKTNRSYFRLAAPQVLSFAHRSHSGLVIRSFSTICPSVWSPAVSSSAHHSDPTAFNCRTRGALNRSWSFPRFCFGPCRWTTPFGSAHSRHFPGRHSCFPPGCSRCRIRSQDSGCSPKTVFKTILHSFGFRARYHTTADQSFILPLIKV